MDTGTSVIQQLTCLYLKVETTARVYDVRDGFSTVFTDLFENVTSVTVNGVAVTYTPMFWSNRNATTFNSIVLDNWYGVTEVTVTADWVIPNDLVNLILKLNDTITNSTSGRVTSKKIEDFSITLNGNTDVDQFVLDNRAILDRYSICGVSNVRSGDVCDYWTDNG